MRHPWMPAAIVLLSACAHRAPRVEALDWNAKRLHVHIDSVDAARIELFEGARRRWLLTLQESGHLNDGRPLFWSGRRGSVQRYFTFYPFSSWSELDARSAVATRTNEAVGKAAVADYDRGDEALVPPHVSEIWLREPDLDYVPPGGAPLTELTANEATLEFRGMPTGEHASQLDLVWGDVRKSLVKAGYPLPCRAYWNLYGRGELVLLWLAPDAGSLDAAPPLAEALGRTSALSARLDALVPIRETLKIERRIDLSNLSGH
jgi:hypothetical protein